jgi:Fe-Mn family superoxide dismutase
MNNLRHYKFELPPLPYGYGALEPYIDEKTMRLHHDAHLKTYVDNLNAALSPYPELYGWTLEQLIYYADFLPENIRTAVEHNAGGVYNHTFFFENMSPKKSTAFSDAAGGAVATPNNVTPHGDSSTAPYGDNMTTPRGNLLSKIDYIYGGIENFKKLFKADALAVFGSGYTWLAADKLNNLKLLSTANQKTPLKQNLRPILCIDVWEHGYYLKHYNKRADYIDDWFNLINFESAEKNYDKNGCGTPR